jgi:hypothetical protein
MKIGITSLVLVLCVAFFASCVGMGVLIDESPAEHWQYTVREKTLSSGVNELTGGLSYRRRPVGSFFSEIVIRGQGFIYHSGSEENTDAKVLKGYIKDPQWTEPARVTVSAEFTREDRSRGWYEGAYGFPKNGTPSDWVWVRRESVKAFVHPGYLEEFAGFSRLEPQDPAEAKRYRFRVQYDGVL